MADNSRDVALNLSVNATGQQAIDDLAQRVKDLGKSGASAAPEFQQLVTEIEALSQQSGAVSAVAELTDEVAKSATAQEELQSRAGQLGEALSALAAKTTEAKSAESSARAELLNFQDALFKAQQALKTLRNETDVSDKQTSDYKASVRALTTEIIATQSAIRDQAKVVRDAADASKAAEQAQRSAQQAYQQVAKSTQATTDALTEQQRALGDARETMAATGLATQDLAEAQLKLQQAIGSVSFQAQAIEAQRAAAAEQAESDRLVAVVEANRARMLTAAVDQLAAENRAQAEAAALFERYEQQKLDARRAEQAESDRLAQIMLQSQTRLIAAGADQLAAERKAQAEAAATFERYQQEKVAAAQKAVEQINSAFATTGTRSLEAIRAEADAVEGAIGVLSAQFRAGAVSAESLERAVGAAQAKLQALNAEAAKVPAPKGKFEELSGAIGDIITRFGALTATLGIAAAAFKPLVDAAVQLDSMRRALTAVTGSADEAEKQIEFLTETAKRSGLAIGDISENYVRFAASARAAGISSDVVQKTFSATALAAGNLGLSSQRVGLILDALSQMANKGTVAMEELRRQLGDSLPGALALMAKGLGLTEQELTQLVTSGKLLASDALPALANALQALGPAGGQVKGLSASFAQFKNAITETMRTFADSGFSDLLIGALKGISTVLFPLVVGFSTLFDTVITGFRELGVVIAAFVTGDFKDLGPAMNKMFDDMVSRQAKLIDSLQQTTYFAGEQSAAMTKVATSNGQAAASSDAAAKAAQQQAQAHEAAVQSGKELAKTQGDVVSATSLVKSAAEEASQSWARLTLDYVKANTVAEQQVEVAQKLAAAKKIEGEASVAVAQLSGDERDLLTASANAALNYAQAMSNLSDRRRVEVALLQSELEAMKTYVAVHGDAQGQKEKEIKALEQEITARQAELEKTQAATEAAKDEAAARTVTRQAYEDNSKALGDLKAAYEFAAGAAQTFHDAQKIGAASDDQVADADRRAAAAKRLYIDALNDTVAAFEREESAIQRNLNLTVMALEVDREKSRALQAQAQAEGNQRAVIEETINQKEIDVKITQAQAEAAKAEAKAILAAADAERTELEVSGQLTPAKQAEIDARIANAKAKQLEADKDAAIIDRLNAEIDAIRRTQQAQTAGSISNTKHIDGETDALNKKIDAQQQSLDLTKQQQQVDANGFTKDQAGNTINAQGYTLASILDQLKGYGLDNSAAYDIARQFTDDKGEVQFFNNPGQVRYGGSTLSDGVMKAFQKYVMDNGPGVLNGGSGNASGSTSHTVTINLNGKSTSINTSSAGDAQALSDLLKQLENAAGRTGP